MDQVKVKKAFNDKETGLLYAKGDLYPKYVEPTLDRIATLIDGDFIEGPVYEFPNEPVVKNEISIPDSSNKVAEIKSYLDAKGIAYSSDAKKDELLTLVK